MHILDKFIKDVNRTSPKEKEEVSLDLYDNPSINRDILKQKIIHNIEMSDEELTELLKESYQDILTCIFEMQDFKYLSFVSTPRFIICLSNIISSLDGNIEYITKVHINSLVYDYITSCNDTTEDKEYVNRLMINLARIVNEDYIRKLLALNIKDDIASFLVLARFSSTNEFANIKRVNFIICTSLSKEFDMDDDNERFKAHQLIVDIYSKLFSKLTTLFESTMYDVYNLEESWVTENISEMYSITTMAVLDILNNMTSPDIRSILISYTNDYNSIFGPKGYTTRFSLNSLSADYNRISYIVECLKQEEKIYVP